MLPINTIFFDLDDVLLSTEESYDNEIIDYLNIDKNSFKDASAELYSNVELSKEWLHLDSIEKENIYYHKFYSQLVFKLGLKTDEETISNILSIRMEAKKNRKFASQSLQVINYLKENYRLGIISNGTPSRREVELKNLGVESLFDPIILSCEVGCKKPSLEIFKIALEKTSISGQQAAFIDNDLENVFAAVECGYGKCILVGNENFKNNNVICIQDILDIKDVF